MDETHDARRNIETARDRMSDIAEELMFRSSPAYLKSRAKEAAVRKTVQTRDRVQTTLKENPTAWKLIGGALGVGLGSMLSRRFQQRDFERSYIGYGREPYGVATSTGARATDATSTDGVDDRDGFGPRSPPGRVRARRHGRKDETGARSRSAFPRPGRWPRRSSPAREVAQEKLGRQGRRPGEDRTPRRWPRRRLGHARHVASDRAHEVRDRLEEIRERIPSGEEVRHRAQDTFHRRVESDPVPILLGAIALGALASFLIPVSDRERRMTGPTRDRVRNKLGDVKAQATSRFEQVKGQAEGTLSSFKEQAAETLTGQQGEQQPLTYGLPNAYDKNLPH